MKISKIFLAFLPLCAVSCYEGYIKDYDTVACGFANQTDVRSVIVGESDSFSTGVALGGVINNTEDRTVSFTVDYSLLTPSVLQAMKTHKFGYIASLMSGVDALEALPASAYKLTTDSGYPGRTVIRKGTHLGVINVDLDMDAFLADEGHLLPYSVIPLRITGTDGTGVISGFDWTVIGVRYENLLFGNWYHGGVMQKEKDGEIVETIEYPSSVPQAENKVWTLTTEAPYALSVNGVGREFSGGKAQMRLLLDPEDDSITIESVPGATYAVEQDGECMFLRSKLLQNRKIALQYKYEADGFTYHAKDTLLFRNRIRDGVNEWQDENQENYE